MCGQGMGHFPNVSDQGALSRSIMWDDRLFLRGGGGRGRRVGTITILKIRRHSRAGHML